MEVKELTFSCCTWPSMPWNTTVSALSSQRPRCAELPLNAAREWPQGSSGLGNASAGDVVSPPFGVPTLWCPLLVGLSSAWWSRDVPHSCLRPSLPFAACSLGAAPSWLSSPGVPLNWEMWVLLPPRNGLRVVSLSSQITLKSVQIVNFRSFLELKLLQLTLLQPQKAIPLKRNYYYYTINPPKHTQRTWFRTRYRNNLSSLCGLEGWYLEQLVKQKCLAPGLALLLNDPLFMCHLSNPWRDR